MGQPGGFGQAGIHIVTNVATRFCCQGALGDVNRAFKVFATYGDQAVPGVGGFEVGLRNDEVVHLLEEFEALVVDTIDVVMAEFKAAVGGDEGIVDGLVLKGFAGALEHAVLKALDVGMEHVEALDLLMDDVIDTEDGCAVAGRAGFGVDEGLDEVPFHAIEGKVVFAKDEVFGRRFDEVVDGLGDFFLEPHAVKPPVGTEFEHGGTFGDELENLLEDALFLGFVDAAVELELEGDLLAMVGAGDNAQAVMHDLLLPMDRTGVLDTGNEVVVRTRQDVVDAEFPVLFLFGFLELGHPHLFEGGANTRKLFHKFADCA